MNFDYFEKASKALQKLEPKKEDIIECKHNDYVINPDSSKVCISCFCVIGYYDDSHDNSNVKKYFYKKLTEFVKVFRAFTIEQKISKNILKSVIKQFEKLVKHLEELNEKKKKRRKKTSPNNPPTGDPNNPPVVKKEYLKEFKKVCLRTGVKSNDVIHYYNSYKNNPVNLEMSDLECVKKHAEPFLLFVKCNVYHRALIYFICKDKLNFEPLYLISMCSKNVIKKWEKLYNNYITSSFSSTDILLDNAN